MLAESQWLCWLLEAGRPEEALALCGRVFRPVEFPASRPWMTKLRVFAGRRLEASALLDRLSSTDFADLPADAQWLGSMTSMA
jgi:hypothetical protein